MAEADETAVTFDLSDFVIFDEMNVDPNDEMEVPEDILLAIQQDLEIENPQND